METNDRRAAFGGWVSARLSRAKRIIPFNRLWAPKHTKARVLEPDEAAKEIARHSALIEKLAPEMLADEGVSKG